MLKLSRRNTLYILIVIAPLAWAGLIIFTDYVPPGTLLTFSAFFLLLGLALTSTFAPLAYVVGLRFLSSRLYRATFRHALRQGVLLALCVILNLVLLALHSWNIVTAVVIIVAAIIIEVVSLARK
jgi:hypothetical protein